MLPCSALLLASLLLPVGQQPRGVTVVRREGDQRLEGKRWVLLIGCDDYQSNAIPKLKYCVADTQALEKVLNQPGTIVVRLGTDSDASFPATRAQILGRVSNLTAAAQPEDEVIVFFSGHGQGGGSKGEQYLLPSDAEPDDLPLTAVSLQLLREKLLGSAAGVRILIVDACRSMARGPSGIDATGAQGLFVLQSCEPGRVSQEDEVRGHGRFSYWLARGLSGEADVPPSGNQDGYVDFDELYRFCEAGMREDAVTLGGQQVPLQSRDQATSAVPILAGPIPGSLVISVAPVEAEVQVGTQPAQKTQGGALTVPGLAPGDLSVVVRAQDYYDETRTVRIEAGQPAPLAVMLRPITAPPAGAGTRAGPVKTITLPGGATMDLVWVPCGSFMMGSNDGQGNERPVHRVALDGFWIGKTEVTVCQWRSVMGSVPEGNGYADDHPVVNVSWEECQAFCQKAGLSLPTEAQWEYAARGPQGSVYPWGNQWDKSRCQSRDDRHGYEQTAPVGSFPSRASWGGALDMAGNVWEWCLDSYDGSSYGSAATAFNPANTNARSTGRAARGGGWDSTADCCRSAFRNGRPPGARADDLGFRASQDRP